MDVKDRAPLVRLDRVSRPQVFARLDSAHIESCRLERERLRAILECDRHDLWRNQGARDHAEFLAGRYGISKWKARRLIGAAYALEYLPRLSHALESGVINIDKVIELSRFATPATERKLITWAKRVSASCIRGRADEETRRPPVEVKKDEEERCLSWWSHPAGLEIEGRLTHADGAVFIAAIDRLANELPDLPAQEGAPKSGEIRIEQRRADALVALCSANIADAQDPDRATVVVHAPHEALTNGRRNAVATNGSVLNPSAAQRLSCDARMDVVLYGENDHVVGIGRASREPPAWLRRQVLKRDSHTCTFPGCEMKRFLRTHHMHWWSLEGPTNLNNLVTVCHTHHKLVHEYGWSVILENDTTPVWFRPSGMRHEPGPAPPDRAERGPDLPPSSNNEPWPALWHWLQADDHALTQDPATKKFLTYAARHMFEGGLTDGRVPGLQAGDDTARLVHVDATAA